VAVSGTEGSDAAFQDICSENNEDVQRLEKLLENPELFKTKRRQGRSERGTAAICPRSQSKILELVVVGNYPATATRNVIFN
jgi:hypothetical protein